MKLSILSLLCLVLSVSAIAQNEGRFSIFSGVSMTSLFNADDAGFGDYQPTFKPQYGVQAAYHFTAFKRLPLGVSVQVARQHAGQNYRGAYADTINTGFYAYSRLNYLRTGLALHFGTNPRKQVALAMSVGMNMGFLTDYQERYELIRSNRDRYILDIRDKEVELYDTITRRGTLTEGLYNKTDMALFGTMGLDFLVSSNWVIGFFGRLDYGFSPVENTDKITINYDAPNASTEVLKYFKSKVKYHGPVDDKISRATTTNIGYGLYLTLRYRLYNKEKTEFYYRENRDYNHD